MTQEVRLAKTEVERWDAECRVMRRTAGGTPVVHRGGNRGQTGGRILAEFNHVYMDVQPTCLFSPATSLQRSEYVHHPAQFISTTKQKQQGILHGTNITTNFVSSSFAFRSRLLLFLAAWIAWRPDDVHFAGINRF